MPIIFDGAFKGLADSKWSGLPGSFAVAVGVDGHSTPGTITAQQKLKKDSASTVDAFPKVAVAASNGYTFWFSSTTGKIWARNSSGTWSLAYTTSAGAGGSGCLGAMEYNGYIYWATESRLHRVAIADADDAWASVGLNFATFTKTDASFHPMAIQDLTLFIGDGNLVAEVNSAGTFTANVLDLTTPYRIKALIDYDIDLLIGTYIADTVNRAEIFRWDTVSSSWNTSDKINEAGINAFIRDDNYLYVSAGLAGGIYYYDGSYLLPFKRMPGSFTTSKYGLVHPGSVANFRGVPVFGFSNGSGDPALEGVYSFGSYSRDYPKVLDLSWVISEAVTTGIEIGAIIVAGFDLLVAWKNGSTFGVDIIDWSNKYNGAYFETRMLFQTARDMVKTVAQIEAFYNSLPASTGITFSYSVNGAGYVSMTSITDAILASIKARVSVTAIGSLQFKVAFTCSGNTAPVLEGLAAEFK